MRSCSRSRVGDAVDGIGPVVGDQERSILHLQHIHWAACTRTHFSSALLVLCALCRTLT